MHHLEGNLWLVSALEVCLLTPHVQHPRIFAVTGKGEANSFRIFRKRQRIGFSSRMPNSDLRAPKLSMRTYRGLSGTYATFVARLLEMLVGYRIAFIDGISLVFRR